MTRKGTMAGDGESAYVVLVLVDHGGPGWELGADVDAVRRTLPAERRRGLLATLAPGGERLVLLVPAPESVDGAEARSVADDTLRVLGTSGHRAVAAVSVAQSSDAIAAAVEEAHGVMHAVRALEYTSGTYHLDDVIIELALLRSPDLVRFLSRRIAPLQTSNAPLLETLAFFLDSGQDRRKAARLLHIHPNTLIYRLRRIRELTGLSPTVPKDIQTLGAAVRAWRLTRVRKTG